MKRISYGVACLVNPTTNAELTKELTKVVTTILPTIHGQFKLIAYMANTPNPQQIPHIALVKGEITPNNIILVRIHSECLTGDVLGSLRCDCGFQLGAALTKIGASECGVLIYLRQEGRGIGFLNKLRTYELQDQGMDTVDANLALGFPVDPRDYRPAAFILQDLGVKKIRLMTNNPSKLETLQAMGFDIIERVPLQAPVCDQNALYLRTKRFKMGHLLNID